MPIRKQIQFLQCWTVQGDNEDDIDEQINDSDTEFIAPREIDEPDNSNILTPEADVHIITTVVERLEKTTWREKNVYSKYSRAVPSLRRNWSTILRKCKTNRSERASCQPGCFGGVTCSSKQSILSTKRTKPCYECQGDESIHWCQLF